MDTILWLQEWYAAQCDGEWEHQQGVEIGTLDNPGWRVAIDLAGTALEETNFATVDETDTSADDWVYCEVAAGTFRGAGGPGNLLDILQIFRSWAEAEGECSFRER